MLCGSHNDLGVILALKKLGFYIIVAGNKKLPADKFADKKILADYSDMDLMLSIAKTECIDAVCQCCNDFGVYTASYIAEKLHLKGYDSYETTLLLHNKDKFKKYAKEKGLLSPISEGFTSIDDALKKINTFDLPVIVKPIDCSAGNGVSVVHYKDEFNSALQYAFSFSKASKIVVEPYVDGTQHGFCTYLKDKKVIAVSSNNEYSFLNPYRVEIDTYPSSTFEQSKEILINEIEFIAKDLNLCDGIFHLQYIFSKGKPYIIEVMRRTLGNMYSVLSNKLNNIDWDYWEAKTRVGYSVSDFPKAVKQEGFYAYKTIVAKSNGVIKKISISDNISKYVFSDFMLLKEGDFVENYLKQPLGFLFLVFSSKDEMDKVLIRNYDLLDVNVELEELC